MNKKKILRYLGESTRAHKDRAYTTEEIAALLDCADLRLRSIILILSSCGCRVGAIPQLKISNLALIHAYDLYQIITLYESAKEEYFSFTTPECKKVINDYLQFRERSGERVTPRSPLIREQFDINDQLQISKPKPLAMQTFEFIFDNVSIKAGLRERRRKRYSENYINFSQKIILDLG